MTIDELRSQADLHEAKADRLAIHGRAIAPVVVLMTPVVVVFSSINRPDLSLWSLGIQLTLLTGQIVLLKRFKHEANVALAYYIQADLMERSKTNHKRGHHQ